MPFIQTLIPILNVIDILKVCFRKDRDFKPLFTICFVLSFAIIADEFGFDGNLLIKMSAPNGTDE